MNFTGSSIILPLLSILTLIVVLPALVLLMSRAKKRKQKTYLKRLGQFKLSRPRTVVLPKYPAQLLGFVELVVGLGVILGLPLLLGKFAGTILPKLFHFNSLVVFPLRGEFVLMGISFVVFACVAMMLMSGASLFWPKFGLWFEANRILQQLQFLQLGYVTKDANDRHKQLEQIASEYNLRAWSFSNLQRQAVALGICLILLTPLGIWLGRTGVWIDESTIIVNSLIQGQRVYTWDQVTDIEISIEDVGSRRTVYSPTFKFFFADQTSVDVWESAFVDLTQELKETCGIAQQHDIRIFISPLVLGRLDEFNQRKQSEITSVTDSAACRSYSYTIQF